MTWPVAFILLVCLGIGIAVVGFLRSIDMEPPTSIPPTYDEWSKSTRRHGNDGMAGYRQFVKNWNRHVGYVRK